MGRENQTQTDMNEEHHVDLRGGVRTDDPQKLDGRCRNASLRTKQSSTKAASQNRARKGDKERFRSQNETPLRAASGRGSQSSTPTSPTHCRAPVLTGHAQATERGCNSRARITPTVMDAETHPPSNASADMGAQRRRRNGARVD
jgi:hypothetical protein